jgi:hypothetical protein
LEESVSGFRAVTMLIPRPTIIIRMGIICDRIMGILSRIRTDTVPGTMAIERITAPIAIIIATTIKPA